MIQMKYKNKGKSILVRKIRGRFVRINGVIFEPRNRDGIEVLDGKRCAFGLYWTATDRAVHWYMEPYVSLWGSEEMYNCGDREAEFKRAWDAWVKLTTGDDNTIRWHWWEQSRMQSVAFSKRRQQYG